MKINYKKLLKVLFYTLLFFIVNIKLVYSEVIKKITISGNERLANETIVLFSELNINDSINSEDLNNAFRKLWPY